LFFWQKFRSDLRDKQTVKIHQQMVVNWFLLSTEKKTVEAAIRVEPCFFFWSVVKNKLVSRKKEA
jgi:hypothetical protein